MHHRFQVKAFSTFSYRPLTGKFGNPENLNEIDCIVTNWIATVGIRTRDLQFQSPPLRLPLS
jgi:hypothetical protein